MEIKEAQKLLVNASGPMADALRWALDRITDLEENEGIVRVLRRRLENAEKLVHAVNPDVQWISEEERFAIEKMAIEQRAERFIGGYVAGNQLFLIRGNCERIVVPLAWFTARTTAIDFSRFGIIDYGSTVAFGAYEVSNYAILADIVDEHTENCCAEHGCTFNDRDCTVVRALARAKPCRCPAT